MNRNLRYREGALEPGERIVVCGHARREPDPDGAAEGASYRDHPGTIDTTMAEGCAASW